MGNVKTGAASGLKRSKHIVINHPQGGYLQRENIYIQVIDRGAITVKENPRKSYGIWHTA
jgi:hypothetical protein